MLDIRGGFTIVGDLHGHVLELLRIFCHFGLPPHIKYVVLGDLVDRGEFSIHITLYLLTLKCCYPDSVFIIRGNHEFETVNASRGLKAEVVETDGSDGLFHAFNRAFSHLPIAARLNGDVL
jgi:protein phosphatase